MLKYWPVDQDETKKQLISHHFMRVYVLKIKSFDKIPDYGILLGLRN